MKKILLIALLLIPFIGFSQTTKPIDGFLGIKFGSSKAVVMAAMKAKGAIYDKANSDVNTFSFTNAKLGHRIADAFYVDFVNGKAYDAIYIFDPKLEEKVIGEYNDLVNDITGFYGPGAPTKNYSYPYKEGDENILLGLSSGKIEFYTLWYDTNKNSIEVDITTDMVVRLIYENNALAKDAAIQQKKKESSDF